MAVDRLSVTVPAELGAALRALAERTGEAVSTLVADAIAQKLRSAALDVAVSEAERRFGPIPEDLILAAEADFDRMSKRRRGKRRRSTRR